MLDALHHSLISLIYPQECRICLAHVDAVSDGVACAECWKKAHFLTGNELLCDKCGAFLGDDGSAFKAFCGKCNDHYYDYARAIGIYESALAASIIALKSKPFLPGRIRHAIKNSQSISNAEHFDLIIPIPLSKRRRIERGYNQAEIIAAEFGNALRIPVDSGSLARKLHTPFHRVGMDQKARELTVKNAFEVVRPKLVAGKNILLVDDVLTSGSTASYCAKALKKSGAAKVIVLTIARAVLR